MTALLTPLKLSIFDSSVLLHLPHNDKEIFWQFLWLAEKGTVTKVHSLNNELRHAGNKVLLDILRGSLTAVSMSAPEGAKKTCIRNYMIYITNYISRESRWVSSDKINACFEGLLRVRHTLREPICRPFLAACHCMMRAWNVHSHGLVSSVSLS